MDQIHIPVAVRYPSLMQDFEKLGAFYLGRAFDLEKGQPKDELVLYDSSDLTTHAVIVGMTGSGKTGLGIGLLEEAVIDGIPAIAIDPKGDLGNLLLTFPELRPADFRPWIDEGEATRAGQSAEAAAAATAESWKKGLAEWGQDGARIARLKSAAEAVIYTPGSRAGRSLSVFRSLAAPAPAVRDDAEASRERVGAAVSALLALLGIEADPLRSREHILLATLIDRAWQAGSDVDLAGLIRDIQKPPVERVGVLDLESFFPEKERFELAMRLNNLLASPGFAAWLEGDPLDIGSLLHTADGRPRLSIVSIAHLSDAERTFFVTLLLGEIVAWMRAQAGTSSLRAILYMDEVFGYLPPTANPPTKAPLLTLLKQARAFGLGVVLATQNPVDLDYKALTNAGTWLVGRLQAERDKARLLDGLEGASAAAGRALDRGKTDAILSALPKRVFLMHDVHEDAPVVMQTRWTLSYLRGPLTREQIRTLSAPEVRAQAAPAAPRPAAVAVSAERGNAERPLLPPDVEEVFVGAGTAYRPTLLATARLHHVNAAAGMDAWRTVALLAELPASGSDIAWDAAQLLAAEPSLASGPAAGATFQPLPACAARAASYKTWRKEVTSHFQSASALTVWRCAELKETSRPDESEGDFRARLAHAYRERRDAEKENLRQRFAPKLAALEEQVRQAEGRVAREESQYGQQKMQAAISVGATVLGALFGRKVASVGSLGRATTAMRTGARAMREREDVGRAQEGVEAKRERLAELQAEFDAAAGALASAPDPASLRLDSVSVAPRKADLSITRLALAWVAAA
jgi:DNA helicase HerA-like ATPase